MSGILEKARAFERENEPLIAQDERPAFHVTPSVGWMNDPNGLSYYKGEYHLFYQYHPYSTEWGPMHWGHVKTRDFIRWERLPVAMAPDQVYDRAGCFSGSAAVLPDGRHLLVYTGVEKQQMPDGSIKETQTQCLAMGDGVNYEKWSQNPVLTQAHLPAGGSSVDFRDPKVWQEPDGSYRLVVGNRTEDGSGAVLLYQSEDGFHWALEGVVDASHNEYGRMWECPDFFPLDGEQVLFVSPQEMRPMGLEFHGGHGTLCIMGTFDKKNTTFTRQHIHAIDYGIDFYAPQTLESADGRRIMIGWLQNWNTLADKPRDCRWFGQMAIPRELSIRNGRLIQTPVRELEQYRRNKVVHQDVLVQGETALDHVEGRMIDMVLNIRPADGNAYDHIQVNLAKDESYVTTLRYTLDTNTLSIDRTYSGTNADVVHTRSLMVADHNGALKLRILMDRYSIEVFVNDGEQAVSTAIFTQQTASGITFEAKGAVLLDVEKYDISLA